MTDLPLRALGVLPLLFFISMALFHVKKGRWGDAFWMCHASNLLLAVGLFFEKPTMVAMALPWLLFGIPLWLGEAVRIRRIIPLSVVTHWGGALVAFYAAHRWGAGSDWWWKSLIFALAVQGITRWATPAVWNINAAHGVYDVAKGVFKSFLSFWIFCIGLTAILLWATEKVLTLFFPAGG
ncbi:MAG: hypothetical protein IPN65_04305 [Elusimicrobia bacterium]|nr:hypothetical protein [Elusimicrobiota bacterium]MBK7545556.1 hypothetical protein [Elusimicrobiota bacterium]MBK7575252.1 hypothetical protein [Elusimicrobiota bacterium]MBK7687893.1 hypothetical protein [Elusimicrobiota bacterium]MBK8125189.1 hypothetical protein [Elusimicrobiota bacterium]